MYQCRHNKFLIFLVIMLTLLVSNNALANLSEVIARIKPSIVGVGTVMETRAPAGKLLGTAFSVGDGKHVLTNAHVVSGILDVKHGEVLAVFVGRGVDPEVRKAEIVALDPDHDLALLGITGAPLPSLTLDHTLSVQEGELYAFTGFPIGSILGLYPATHRGIVSAITPIVAPMDKDKQLNPLVISRLRSPYDVYQLDATAYPGNSGGPVYDTQTGKVVAIINMVFVKVSKESVLTEPSGITYAIPIKYANTLLRKQGLDSK